jgi:hypothetical protein
MHRPKMDYSRNLQGALLHAERKHSLEKVAFALLSTKAIHFLHVQGAAEPHRTSQRNTGSKLWTALQYGFDEAARLVNARSNNSKKWL